MVLAGNTAPVQEALGWIDQSKARSGSFKEKKGIK